MGEMEERAVEVLVRMKGSKPRRPHCKYFQFPTHCECFQFPMGGGVGPAMPASDVNSKRLLVPVSPVFGSLMGSVLE